MSLATTIIRCIFAANSSAVDTIKVSALPAANTTCCQQIIDPADCSTVLVQPYTFDVRHTLPSYNLADSAPTCIDQVLREIKEIPDNRRWCMAGITGVITADGQHDARVTPQQQRSHSPYNSTHLPRHCSKEGLTFHIHPHPIHTQPLVVLPPLISDPAAV